MRIQVNLSEEMVSRVDFYAKKLGVPRSTLCSVLIGQSIVGFDTAYGSLSDLLSDLPKKFDLSSSNSASDVGLNE